jgi:hypothetical protein
VKRYGKELSVKCYEIKKKFKRKERVKINRKRIEEENEKVLKNANGTLTFYLQNAVHLLRSIIKIVFK